MEKIETIAHLPFKENLSDVAFYLRKIHGGKLENYVHAFLLKWAIEEKLLIVKNEKGSWTKQETGTILLLEEESVENTIESLIWNILLNASNEENKISDQELKNLVKTDAMLFIPLGSKLINDSKNHLIQNGYLEEEERRIFSLSLKKSQKNTANGDELYRQLQEYFHYLENLIRQGFKAKDEIKSWPDTLIWISLFGLADDFYSQTKKISSQQLEIETGLPSQLCEMYKKLSSFFDNFSIGFTYAKNSVNNRRSCC